MLAHNYWRALVAITADVSKGGKAGVAVDDKTSVWLVMLLYHKSRSFITLTTVVTSNPEKVLLLVSEQLWLVCGHNLM